VGLEQWAAVTGHRAWLAAGLGTGHRLAALAGQQATAAGWQEEAAVDMGYR
jgi:hypothetical protein